MKTVSLIANDAFGKPGQSDTGLSRKKTKSNLSTLCLLLLPTVLYLITFSSISKQRLTDAAFRRSEVKVSSVPTSLPRRHVSRRHVSRFHVRWRRLPILRSRSPAESGYRFLYSPIASTSTDGLGHALATYNVEVFTALQLGLTYTHRISTFGWVTKSNPSAVEDAFGLGIGEIPRSKLQRDVCALDAHLIDEMGKGRRKRVCPICSNLNSNTAARKPYNVNKLIQMPNSWTALLSGICLGKNTSVCDQRLSRLKLDKKNSVYVMPRDGCDTLIAYSDFTETAPWFQRKYWLRHEVPDQRHKSALRSRYRETRVLTLNDSELSIAVHARRGDFLSANSTRQPTSSRTFVEVIKASMSILRERGGAFSDLPVGVHVFSEGRYKNGYTAGHALNTMTKDYIDVDGTFQDSTWWESELSSLSLNDQGLRVFQPPRVYMHISVDTVSSIHDMSSADIFVGSKSGMSENIVRVFSRGVLLLPCPLRRLSDRTRVTCYEVSSGNFSKPEMLNHWSKYADDFEEYVASSSSTKPDLSLSS